MSLRIWLPLNGDLKNNGLDDFSITTYGTTSYVDSKLGKGLNCNRYSYWVIDNINVGSNMSITFWAKAMSNGMAWVLGSNDSALLNFWAYNDTYYLNAGDAYNNPFKDNSNTNVVSFIDGTWHHFAVIFNSTETKLYIDGEYAGKAVTFRNPTTTNGILKIGGGYRDLHSHDWYGVLNDFRLYDCALSIKEIKEISRGLVLHYELNGIEVRNGTNLVTGVTKGGQTTLLTDGRIGVQTSGSNADTYFTIDLSESIVNGNKYFLSCDASGISDGKYWGFPLGAQGNSILPFKIYNGHNEYWFTANDISWGTNRLFMDDQGREDWANPACFFNFQLYKIGTNTQLEVIDSSGYGHNGLLYHYDTNGFFEINNNSPRYDKCIYINSENNTSNTASGTVYIYGNCELTNPTQLSVAFWCKPIAGYRNDTGQGQFCFTNYNYGNSNVGVDYQTSTMNHRDGRIDINDSTGTTQCRPYFSPIANEWHHYVITYDGQIGKVYKDGIQSSTAQFSENKILGSCKGLVIGFSRAGGVWRSNKSYFSDFRVYTTALSADDIKSLYQTTISVDKNNNFYSYSYNELNQGNEIEYLYNLSKSQSGSFIQDKDGLHLNQYVWVTHDYIPINPTNKIYKYDIIYSNDAGNLLYIGWERYDANKTSRSNNACVYVLSNATERNYYRIKGTVDLSTDTVNPCAFIKLRILNKWTGSDSDTNGTAIIHYLSLKEYTDTTTQDMTPLNINKQGIVNTTEILEKDIGVSVSNVYELNSHNFYEY